MVRLGDDEHERHFALRHADVLRQTALATTVGGLGGVGVTAGTAAASDACGKDNASDPGQQNVVWNRGDGATSVENCDNGYARGQRLDHRYSAQYILSVDQSGGDEKSPEDDPWVHFFSTAGHAEYYSSGYNCDTWERAAGLQRHRTTVERLTDSGFLTTPTNGYQVAGRPADGDDNGLIEDVAQQAAMTAMTEAVGYVVESNPITAAAGVALGLLGGSNGDDQEGGDEIMYEWDYSPYYYKCGSHFLNFDLRRSRDVGLKLRDEAWGGKYPNYTSIIDYVSIADPVTDNVQVETVSADDIIKTTRGERARVTDVNEQVRSTRNSEPQEVSSDAVPAGILKKYDLDTSSNRFMRFPVQARTQSISGKLID